MEILAWFGIYDYERSSLKPFDNFEDNIQVLIDGGNCPEEMSELRHLAKVVKFVKNDEEYNALICKTAIALVRRQLDLKATEEEDLLHEAETLDDLNLAINLLDERLYEWSRLHIDKVSHGSDLAVSLKDDKVMGELARTIMNLRESHDTMEDKIGKTISRLAPNLSMLAGPILATRLISRAGSLKRLAEMPSSAVQLLGAEKALFRHLKGKAPPPKHGLIYRHPSVSGSPRKLRGRMARALACKLAIAARLDFYRGALHPELREALERKVANIKRKGKASPRQ
ncbi:MAG: ATP-binding protein [Methanotrichaceae archaeon]|nr:ATP-binding protein [Methanotrichaceae archaeon]